ncbi:MAG TPA: UDP-N-acetylglucosamine 2-epimerase (non-hydrolyzing), partial [Gemmatimonadetes bacterium]|nr:UDP-N-acetylglucosamine 2-epimerase (non-hydrolyzing) [Gemmatimonadota bacterium]
STLAGALAAAKLNIPIAHVEAGPRNFDRSIPEEINRVITDRLSSLLFAPTEASVENLAAEGIVDGVENTGDVMLDLAMRYLEEHVPGSSIHSRLEIDPDDYYFATLHRAANTDDPVRLRAILSSLAGLDRPVALPLHPRTRERIRVHGFEDLIRDGQIRVLDAVGYVDSLALQAHARLVFTDSGG